MKAVAEIVIENASPTFDKPYSYLIPDSLLATALPGARVRVPFGRGNTKRTGLILSCGQSDETKGYKAITQVLDTPPILSEEGLLLLHYLREYTFSTWFDALRFLIPAGLGITPKISFQLGDAPAQSVEPKAMGILNYLAKKKKPIGESTFYKSLELTADDPVLRALLSSGHVMQIQELRQKILDDKVTMVQVIEQAFTRLSPRQQEVLDFLLVEAPVSLKEASYYTGASRSVLDALRQKGFIDYYEVVRPRGEYVHAEAEEESLPPLSVDQQEVYAQLKSYCNKDSTETALLYGVTGSGKTQVFLKLVEDTLATGKGAIVMVPEISLTSQTVTSLQQRFGNLVAVLHSGLSLGERMDEWKRIRDGEAPIVVGTRSAVFAPLAHIGLIVMDEEQEHTYKSDQSPRFHARDVARVRMNYHKGLLLLCSATPAVESFYHAQQNRYHLLSLPDRFGEALLPDVQVVDMTNPSNLSASLSLSAVLLEELFYNLEHKEQSILLLNRRGYSTVVKCTSCGEAAQCPNCSVAMTYHAANDRLICHYCGYGQKRTDHCPSCHSEFMRYSGIGTQKLEEELKGLFPHARILRMDADTTMGRDSHQQMFDSFRSEEYDILIGTQMVAKGLNFPRVTLVGVISADQSLYADDFRSYERSFSLLTQVVGRSGRGQYPGRALIQTYSPEHPIINMASQQDYAAFFSEEISSRKLHLYPPFCTLAGLGFVGKDHEQVQKQSILFAREFQRLASADYPHLPLRVLGPSPSDVLKVAEKYRYKLVVKCKNNKETRVFFRTMLDWFYKNCRDVSLFIDMYYERM